MLDTLGFEFVWPVRTIVLPEKGRGVRTHEMLRWSIQRSDRLQHVAPGRPTQTASVNALNSRVQDERIAESALREA